MVATLDKMAHGVGEQFIYLVGNGGFGKSHLLQAVCHRAPEHHVSVLYLPLQEHLWLSAKVLDGLEQLALICIDDIDAIAGQPEWEEALFHLYNRVRDQHGRMIVAAKHPALQTPIVLPDLKTRLSWGLNYTLTEMEDEEKLQALQLHAKARGLDLDEAVGRFLLKRCPRDLKALFTTLEQLDQASLAEQRRLTIPFVKQVLQL